AREIDELQVDDLDALVLRQGDDFLRLRDHVGALFGKHRNPPIDGPHIWRDGSSAPNRGSLWLVTEDWPGRFVQPSQTARPRCGGAGGRSPGSGELPHDGDDPALDAQGIRRDVDRLHRRVRRLEADAVALAIEA